MITDSIIEGTDIVVQYGALSAVDGVSFKLEAKQTLGIVGESGCGKSSLGRAIIHMPAPTSGSVKYRGTDLHALRPAELRAARLDLQMVFQDPKSSLHPKWTVEEIVREPLDVWRRGNTESKASQVHETLAAVGLDPKLYAGRKAAELSGGQCQRVAIARALVAGAKVLVCDEPISSLDVSLRATVLNLLEELRETFELSIIFIAHDLAVVRNVSDRVMVMYLGRVVEEGTSSEVFGRAAHPYTRVLLDSVPRIDGSLAKAQILGEPPSPLDVPSGCRFRTRCPFATERCAAEEPALREIASGHLVACHYA